MARLLNLALRAASATSTLLDAVLATYAQVLFSRSSAVGALLLAATAFSRHALACGLVAIASAAASEWLLGLGSGATSGKPYRYNALLVGLGVAQTYAAGPRVLALVVASAVAATLVCASCVALSERLGFLPILSLPFVLVFWLVLSVAPAFGLVAAHSSSESTVILPESFAAPLSALGALVFLPRADAGGLVLAALLVHSRIALLLAMLAGFIASHVAPSVSASASLNAALTAVALGGVWFVPSSSSFGLGMVGALLASVLTVGMASPPFQTGLPALILPFNVASLLALLAMRRRAYDRSPKSVDFLSGSPEENLSYFQTRLARFRSLYPVSFRLPFRGAWTCTQGIDGALTHQLAWRHAFDFEACGAEGSLFKDGGARVEDYHCFKLPVLAAADGVVVKVQDEVPDNAIGEVELQKNWGNVVVVQHAVGLYSLVAHLARASVRVREGQAVRRGDVLGLCGSSGRSPRPHLHFQLQASAQVGAATLPSHFSDVVVRAGGERVALAVTPREGETIRNLEPDSERAAPFALRPGAVLRFATDRGVEHVEHSVDVFGNFLLSSRESGVTLSFSKTDDGFTAYDPLGSARSVLHLFRAALPRVMFDAAPGLVWTDYLPVRWSGWSFLSPLREFSAPFVPRVGLEMTYHAERDGDRLLVRGASRRRGRGGPSVETSATLSGDGGLLSIDVRAGHKQITAERLRDDRFPASVARDSIIRTRRTWLNTAKALGMAAFACVVWPRSGVVAHADEPRGAAPPTSSTGVSAQAFQRSYEAEAAGRNAAALAVLDRLNVDGNARYVAELRRGWLLYRLARYPDSVLAYGRADELEPLGIEAKVGSLGPLAALARWSEVESTARDVLDRDPANYVATLRSAYAQFRLGKLREAERAYKALTVMYPSDVEARTGLAWSQLKLGHTANAQSTFDEVLAVAPEDVQAQQGLAASRR